MAKKITTAKETDTAPEAVRPRTAPRSIMVTEEEPSDRQADDPVVRRTAKTIQPLSHDQADSAPPPEAEDTSQARPEAARPEEDRRPDTGPSEDTALPTDEAPPDSEEDAEAAEVAKTAAAEKKRQELEALIVSGEYYVPINAVKRKRSKMVLACLLVAVTVVAIGTVDLLADAGTIRLPSSIPHTRLIGG